MSADPETTADLQLSWRRKSGLATWIYRVPAMVGETPEANLLRSLRGCKQLLSGFARVAEASVTTRFRGDDAFVFSEPASDEIELVLSRQIGGDEARRVILSLDLWVNLGQGDADVRMQHAADLFLELDEQSDVDGSVKLWLDVDIDIYASRTWGDIRENAELARLNGPRLRTFLSGLMAELGLTVEEVYASGYRGVIDERGFL